MRMIWAYLTEEYQDVW